MFAVCVELQVKPGKMAQFLPLMQENATASLRDEAGCKQFDVARCDQDDHLVLLYELYDDAAAFETHKAAPHFKAFDAATAQMLVSKQVRTGTRIVPD